MKAEIDNNKSSGILYSCYYKSNREGEHFVPHHTLTYQIAGSLVLTDGAADYVSQAGSFQLVKRNQLLKFIKHPPEHGEFRSLSVYLDQQILRNYSLEYGITAGQKRHNKPVFEIKSDAITRNYINSLLEYHQAGKFTNRQLVELKLKEGILLILQSNPEVKNILFDFTEPHKTDLESFMNKNYHFNVHLDRFAYLTGRSLATFKRDFEKTFNSTPGRWLQQKRLQEAHYLITEKGKTASDIYLDLGFEDLSHFSFAFKKQFGEAPTKIVG